MALRAAGAGEAAPDPSPDGTAMEALLVADFAAAPREAELLTATAAPAFWATRLAALTGTTAKSKRAPGALEITAIRLTDTSMHNGFPYTSCRSVSIMSLANESDNPSFALLQVCAGMGARDLGRRKGTAQSHKGRLARGRGLRHRPSDGRAGLWPPHNLGLVRSGGCASTLLVPTISEMLKGGKAQTCAVAGARVKLMLMHLHARISCLVWQ